MTPQFLFLVILSSYPLKITGGFLSNYKQVPGVSDLGLKPRRINKVAILGGGLMGSGIATALILSGYPVILKEVNDKFLQAGIDRVKGEKGWKLDLTSRIAFYRK